MCMGYRKVGGSFRTRMLGRGLTCGDRGEMSEGGWGPLAYLGLSYGTGSRGLCCWAWLTCSVFFFQHNKKIIIA